MTGSPLVLVNAFQPTDYAINLAIDHQKSNFTGEITINLTRDSKPIPQDDIDFKIQLNSAELVLLSAVFTSGSSHHKAQIIYNRADETVELVVKDGAVLYKESNLTLTIKYIGKINTIKTYRDFTKGVFRTNYLDDKNNNSTNYIIATHSQASFARYIYPSIDEPSSKATFELSITTAQHFKILSNTLPASRETAAGSQTVKFEKSPPMNTSIFGFIIGDLDFIESTVPLSNKRTIPVRFYTAVGQVQQSAYAHDLASKLLRKIESIFNTPYPLDKLDIIALPFLSDGAMENFGLIMVQSSHILVESLSDKQQLKQIRQLVAHELIHHWIGNNVSFDEWDHLWLNEAFATWFAYYVLTQARLDDEDAEIWEEQGDSELERLLTADSALNAQPIVAKMTGPIKTTQDAFQAHSYSKGIQFLRMLSNVFESDQFDDQLEKFAKCISGFVKKNEFKSIKPADLWKSLHDESGLDLLAFAHSWLRTPGFPLVTVSISEDDKIVLEQHRFLEESTVEEQKLEDVPYHVPLAIKLSDGSVINKVLNDRKLVLDEIKVEEFVKLNSNRIGLYRVHYKDSRLYDNLVKKFDCLSTLDLLGVVHDQSRIIGHDSLQFDEDIVGFLKIAERAVISQSPNFTVLRYILNNLEVLENAYKLQSTTKKHLKFLKWLRQLNLKLFNKLNWTQMDTGTTVSELETKASVLSIGIETPEIRAVSEKLFKKLLHGPRQSVPAQYLAPILSSVSLSANQSNWKKILELVKSPGATTANVLGGSTAEIQNAAIRAIGFTKDPALVKRVLNFVTTNIDSTMVELGLVGLLYNPSLNKASLWDWFKLNYDHWVSRSLRAGSEYSANLAKTVKSITLIVLSAFTKDEDISVVNAFVDEKLKKLPEHGLKENVELVKDSQIEKIKIASSIDALLKFTE